MKELLVATVVCILLFSCKDEFNIPESDSYIDGDAPEVIAIISPIQDEVYSGISSLPINFTVEDNYFLSSIQVEVRDMSTSQNIFNDKVITSDSNYTYSSSFNTPLNETKNYELYITVKDEVENVNYRTVQFSTQ